MIILSKFRNFKLSSKLLLFYLIIFVPLILLSQTIVFMLSRKPDKIAIPLNSLYTFITLDILFFILTFMLLAYVLSRFVTKPLDKFTQILGNSKKGDCSIRLRFNAQDEIGRLALHFNEFAAHIEKYHDQLKEENQKLSHTQDAVEKAKKERRKLLTQLEKAQKMEAIGTLAGGIAHDFNNILSSIFGYAQLAQMSGGNQEKLHTQMDQILKAAQRAAELVEQILTFSRRTENEKRPLKLHLVVKEALKLLRASIPSTIEIVTRVDTIDMVNANPTQMHQLIINLCTNAYHAMMISGGTLTVSLTTVDQIEPEHRSKDYVRPGPFLQLMVKDTGGGKNRETGINAFDSHFTAEKSEQGTGGGLGLTLINAIIEDHNGLSCIENVTGQGTLFFVYLPTVSRSNSSPSSSTGIDAALKPGKETIMIVDDEPDLLALTEEMLNKFGYSAYPFDSGESALHAYQEGIINFDMVITDLTMPRMTGIALAKAILSQNKNMPIILCSGYHQNTTWSEMKEIGIQAFLKKPLDTYLLLKTMRTLFDKKSFDEESHPTPSKLFKHPQK